MPSQVLRAKQRVVSLVRPFKLQQPVKPVKLDQFPLATAATTRDTSWLNFLLALDASGSLAVGRHEELLACLAKDCNELFPIEPNELLDPDAAGLFQRERRGASPPLGNGSEPLLDYAQLLMATDSLVDQDFRHVAWRRCS